MVRMVLVLALAALAVYGVVFFIKRLGKPPEAKDPHLKVLARAPLGSGASAAVLSVGARAWLVGASDGGVSLIAEITEQEALAAMIADEARRSEEGARGGFLALLRRFGGAGENVSGLRGENLRSRQKRLRRF